MKISNEISSEERENAKTGKDLDPVVDETTIVIPEEKAGGEPTAEGGGKGQPGDMTPRDIAQAKYYEEARRSEVSRTKLFAITGICVKVLSTIIGVLALFGIYYISNISEPMGGLKESVENVKETNEELKDRVKAVENKLSETREEFIRKNNPRPKKSALE